MSDHARNVEQISSGMRMPPGVPPYRGLMRLHRAAVSLNFELYRTRRLPDFPRITFPLFFIQIITKGLE